MSTVDKIKALMTRHDMTQEQAARYLGVPVHTLIKWTNGTRNPNKSVERLIEVLGVVEALAPAINDNLVKEAKK